MDVLKYQRSEGHGRSWFLVKCGVLGKGFTKSRSFCHGYGQMMVLIGVDHLQRTNGSACLLGGKWMVMECEWSVIKQVFLEIF